MIASAPGALLSCSRRIWGTHMNTLDKFVVVGLFCFIGGCSGTESTAPMGTQSACPGKPAANGGYQANCSFGFSYNGHDVGTLALTHNADPSKSCDDYQSTGKIDSKTDFAPGEVSATMDSTTGRIEFSVDSTKVEVSPSDKLDWLWVRSSVPGAAGSTDKEVYCPGLEAEAAKSAQDVGASDAKSCPGDPNRTDLGEFYCKALDNEIKSRDAYTNMHAKGKEHKMAAAVVMLAQSRELAFSNGGTKRAAALPILGVIFTALGQVFSSSVFQPKPPTEEGKVDVAGPEQF